MNFALKSGNKIKLMHEEILTDQELAMVTSIAATRTAVARGANVKDAKMGKKSGLQYDIDGFIGEYAFCKWKNIFVDLIPSPRSGSYDCLIKGKRIDVKTTRHQKGRLVAVLKDNPDVDTYVLAIIDENIVSFPGYAHKGDLCQKRNIKNLGHGDGYALDQDQLKKFKQDG